MDYTNTVDFIYGLQKHGLKLGLERISLLLDCAGNPQDSFKSIHIAGTNGKGSVSAITASILNSAGFKTGLFTSPHLVSFTERIKVGAQEITEEEVVRYALKIKDLIEMHHIESTTFFEFVTALAMTFFAESAIECAVIETGMGGRLDATNILNPEVTAITRIGLDHREFLGATIEEIAFEKAGIIKKITPVVSSSQQAPALEVIARRAQEMDAPLYVYGRDFSAQLRDSSIGGITFDFSGPLELLNLHVPLPGIHQMENASTAVLASIMFLKDRLGITEIAGSIREGLSRVRWSGRLDIISTDPQIMIDGAHNPEAAGSLASFINGHLSGQRIVFILGIMADKDTEGILSPLLPLAEKTIFTAPNYSRAAEPKLLADKASKLGFSNYETTDTIKDALERAFKIAGHSLSEFLKTSSQYTEERRELLYKDKPLIVITGSFYTIGEALEMMGKRAVLGSLRETMNPVNL